MDIKELLDKEKELSQILEGDLYDVGFIKGLIGNDVLYRYDVMTRIKREYIQKLLKTKKLCKKLDELNIKLENSGYIRRIEEQAKEVVDRKTVNDVVNMLISEANDEIKEKSDEEFVEFLLEQLEDMKEINELALGTLFGEKIKKLVLEKIKEAKNAATT